MTKAERDYQRDLVKFLRVNGCKVFKNNANLVQGIPDLLVLFNDRWAMLEVKKSEYERYHDPRPNQEYYVDMLDEMSFARFIYPENEKEVLDELQVHFKTCWNR